MGKFKRFVFSFITVVLILLGALFVFGALIDVNELFNLLSYLQNPNVRIGVMVVGIILLFLAIFMLVDLTLSSDHSYERLRQYDDGSILVSRDSLENSVKASVESFLSTEARKIKVYIEDDEEINVECKVRLFKDFDIQILSDKLKEKIELALRDLTGITNIKTNLYFDRVKEGEVARRGNYESFKW